MTDLPIAITAGDASGVGPEIALRLFAAGELPDDVVVYGDVSVLAAGASLLSLDVPVNTIEEPQGRKTGVLNVIDAGMLASSELTPGVLSEAAGRAAHHYVVRATEDAIAGKVSAVVTLPMNKEATQASVPGFIGHTELIAGLCETDDYAMMLAGQDVAVSHVSAHVSLREAIERVEPKRIGQVIRLTHNALSAFIAKPRIAVCGLNPHAGENRMFGDEDADQIVPAIETAIADGLSVSGPHPADTVFYQAVHNDQHDAIICMYHDQGHAPMKLIGFESSVNVTIGLPIIRTSVDHGTAYDIAWRGTAFLGSLRAAIHYAQRLMGSSYENAL
ncbi:MAG: 4-hydroxythreonine-4-phosphate dehydrogenase PdxA [Pseudomonadota bacterium]